MKFSCPRGPGEQSPGCSRPGAASCREHVQTWVGHMPAIEKAGHFSGGKTEIYDKKKKNCENHFYICLDHGERRRKQRKR